MYLLCVYLFLSICNFALVELILYVFKSNLTYSKLYMFAMCLL